VVAPQTSVQQIRKVAPKHQLLSAGKAPGWHGAWKS
jgi:hypothetical protein